VSGGSRVSILDDRIAVPAPGAFGGRSGAPGALSVPAKKLVHVERPVRFDLPGGGGYGPALERDPEAVLRDVLDGYVSRSAAASEYGVVVRGPEDALVLLPGDLYVDEDATARLREEMR
jgi:N-methylhydantoinase B